MAGMQQGRKSQQEYSRKGRHGKVGEGERHGPCFVLSKQRGRWGEVVVGAAEQVGQGEQYMVGKGRWW